MTQALTQNIQALPSVVRLLEQGIERGLHIGAQLYVSRRGQPVADFAVGHARPGVAMTPQTVMLWLSATKPITAIAIAQQHERGRLDLDAPVADYLPAFAQHRKHAITTRHLLTHTGGFRGAKFNFPDDTWNDIIAAVMAAHLEPRWVPGEKAGYHPLTSWFVLGALVEKLSGQPFSQYVRQHIFEPLDMTDCWIGMSPDAYRTYGERLGVMQNTFFHPRKVHPWHELRWCVGCNPGGNGYGPLRQLARFYEMLLNRGELNGARIIQPQTVDLFTSPHRQGLYDHSFKHTIDWGLGFMLDSKHHGPSPLPYGFGRHASPATFGHGGYQSSAAFADPAHDLVVAIVCNGTPGDHAHHQRMDALLTAVYADLDLLA
jgi:CubicO group peptidase (beta-lactamase class C family)